MFSILAFGLRNSQAATWTVEKDGSGDFTVIQDAVNAASGGDTILIGPGRYAETRPFSLPGWTEATIVGIIDREPKQRDAGPKGG